MIETATSIPKFPGYEEALAAERRSYDACFEVHDLPPIFHYWSTKHIQPKLRPFGFGSAGEMFAMQLRRLLEGNEKSPKRFVSLGAGNCDLEISLALQLLTKPGDDFVFECCDLNPVMLERGRASAQALGIGSSFQFTECDLNSWSPLHEYDAVLANQSLHHIINLEGCFQEVRRSLRGDGSFLISDMIGRNGHLRWPEALSLVREFWRKLPPSRRFNHTFGCYEEIFEDWDCSSEGFEGVRSQDILPLLVDRFHFPVFAAFGNIIDPFVDRSFGPNFDIESAWDRAFIDEVHYRDELELESGRLKPTHLIGAAVKNARNTPFASCALRPLPESSERVPDRRDSPLAYTWSDWPYTMQSELETACSRLALSGTLLRERTIQSFLTNREMEARTAWACSLNSQLEERTQWALALSRELDKSAATVKSLQAELEERNRWAFDLNQDAAQQAEKTRQLQAHLQTRTAWALEMQQEILRVNSLCLNLQDDLESRSSWIQQLQTGVKERDATTLRLQRELDERTDWALQLEQSLTAQSNTVELLQSDVKERTEWALELERQLREKSDWCRRLRADVEEQSGHRIRLEGEIAGFMRNPFRLLARMASGVRKRLREPIIKEPRVSFK